MDTTRSLASAALPLPGLGQAYLSIDGIEMIKSKLTNDVFREEMLHLYEQKTGVRDELVQEARKAMLELVQKMRDGLCRDTIMAR